ncbi:MAG: DoxX family protein [Candidatus Marinimicrobia bacterium]|nr:DoxX family protein [Candidatus Neomarinimicrobiota bacterium]
MALLALSVCYIFAGINHFVNPDFYIAIMPPYLPFHGELVFVSGIFELLGGIMVLMSRFRAIAGWGLILLLIAIFPANLHMAFHPELFSDISPIALYIRLPIQFILIVWAYWTTQNPE